VLAIEENKSVSNNSDGYNCGDHNLTERFNSNNVELNKRRFLETNSNIFKNKLNGNKAKGAKFVNQEISFSLTPNFEEKEVDLVPSKSLDNQSDGAIKVQDQKMISPESVSISNDKNHIANEPTFKKDEIE
jgi:hypothetical protein